MKWIMLAAMLLSVPSPGTAIEINDNAKVFSEAAVAKACAEFETAEKVHGTPTLIETIKDDGDQKVFKTTGDKDRYYHEQLLKVAKERDAHGFVVILWPKSRRIEVNVHKLVFADGYVMKRLAKVREAAIPYLKKDDYDGALSAITATINSEQPTAAAITATIPAKPKETVKAASVGWPWQVYVMLAAVVVIVVLFFCVISSRTEPEVPEYVNRYDKAADMYPAVTCPKCGATTCKLSCEHCGSALNRKRPRSESRVATTPTRNVTHIHNDSNSGFTDGLIMGSILNSNPPAQHHHYHQDPTPPASPPSHHSSSYDSSPPSSSYDSGSSGFDFGGGSDFGGSVGGDF